MKNRLAGSVVALLLTGVTVGAMWFDRVNNTAPLVDAVVERVIDGDTIEVLIDEQRVQIRLVGIEAPDLSQNNGQRAQQFLASHIQGQPVRIALEDKDKYGRSLGEIFVTIVDPSSQERSQLSINELLARTGNALAYRYRGEVQYSTYGQLETEARAKKRGLWANAAVFKPWR